MESVKDPLCILWRQADTRVFDGNHDLTFRSQARTNRQLSSTVFHCFDRIQHQVHEHLLKLHSVSEHLWSVFSKFGIDFYRMLHRLPSKESGHFLNYFLDVNVLALGSHSLLVERPQATDYIGRPISILFDSGSRRTRSFQIGRVSREPPQARIGASDGGGYWLPDFVSQCSGEFAHHIHAIDVCEICLQLPQFFTFLFGLLTFGYVHCDTDVIACSARRLVMSNGAQKSNATVGKNHSKLSNVVIRSCSNRILKSLGHSGSIFLMNAVEETFEW